MENIGALAILLAFCFAIYAVIGSVVGKLRKKPFLVVSAERSVYSTWILLTIASGILIYSLLTGDFRMGYVAAHTDASMSKIYKFTAWWGGQEGSLLLWAWLLATYSAIVVFMNRRKFRDMMPWVTSVLMATETFFLILIAFVFSPFQILIAGRGNIVEGMGKGLNPLLQFCDGERFVVETAFQELGSSLERMHVTINQSRHQEPPFQVHRHGRRADKGRQSLIAADVDNPSVANRESLGGSGPGIRRENDAVTINPVGEAGARRGSCGGQDSGKKQGALQSAHGDGSGRNG